MLAACGPSEKEKVRMAEQKRLECLDKYCEGDVEPAHDPVKEFAFKVNGQWFVGPREYGGYGGSFAFLWPSKTPANKEGASKVAPEFVPSSAGVNSNFYDVGIEIFLTGRQRWPEPNAPTPWEDGGWQTRFDELQKQGLRMERQQIRPELERIRFFDAQGNQYRHEYFLATQQRKIRGSGPPGIACDRYPDPRPNALPRCTGGMFWQEDVYADFRFLARHATDWPAIHQEMVRVLNLAKKVQP
jgi:hypothetical protein